MWEFYGLLEIPTNGPPFGGFFVLIAHSDFGKRLI